MLKDDRVIAILALDTQEAGLGVLTGDRWETIDELTSGVAGKHRQGGQSARRFERLRDNELNEYLSSCCKSGTNYLRGTI